MPSKRGQLLASATGGAGVSTATPQPMPPALPTPPARPSATDSPTAPPVAGGVGICNGVADDTAAIQAALSRGGVTTLKAGVCMISATLNYSSNSTLRGAGQDVTTIRNFTTRTDGQIMLQPGGGGVANFTIEHLTLDARADFWGNMDDVFTVSANATSYFLSDHVTYRNVMQMAVWTDGAGTTATDHLTIQNSRVTEAFGDGFSFFGQITDSAILNSEVTHCMDDGIAFQENVARWGPQGYPARIRIAGNTVHDCTERNSWGSTANGINIFGSDNVTVADNRVTNVVSDGLRLTGGINRRATNIHAYNNIVDHAGFNHASNPGVPPWGIHIDQADNVDSGANTIVNCEWSFRNLNSTNVSGFPWLST